MADDRTQMVTEWLEERRGDAETLSTRSAVIAALSQRATVNTPAAREIDIKTLGTTLQVYAKSYRYAGIYVSDASGQVVARTSGATDLPEGMQETYRSIARTGNLNLAIVDRPGTSLLSISAPVYADVSPAPAAHRRALGVVVLIANLDQSLFPALFRESVPTRTGETVLVRRVGDEIAYLTPLRSLPGHPKGARRPYATAPLAGRAALEGRETFDAFIDYRGVPVLAATRRIELTGWGLFSKIDRAEALQDFRRLAWTEGLAAALLLLAFGGLLVAYRRYAEGAGVSRERGRFRALVDATAQIVWTTNPQGEVTDIPDWRAFTGQSLEEVRGWGWTNAVHPEDRERTAAIWREALRNRSLYDTEYRVRRKDGEYRYFSARGVPVLDADGSIGEWVGFCADIHERKHAEEALRRANAYNRSLIEASLDPLVTISAEGKVTDVNTATEAVTGRTREELIGTDFSDYFTEPGKARAGYQQVFREGSVQDYDLEIRHRNGHLTPVLYNASVYRDEAGVVIGVFAAARDISGQKRAAEALRQANAYNRSLIEASLDPLVTISPEGKITDVNSATEKVTGSSRSELIGRDFSDYFTEPEKARAGYQQVFREGFVHDYELEIRHRDGHLTPVLYNATVYRDERGEVVGVFAAARDITARRQAEEEVRKLNESLEQRVRERTAELEAANKELEAFTYSVSHDLRAPLRHVDGFSKLLLEEFAPQLPQEGRHFLERIRGGTRQMGQLVDDLLNLSRVGRRELSLQITGLSSLVEEVIGELKAENPDRLIDWKIASLPFVECDPTLMKQVLLNLLSNAVKFTRPREQAVIEVGTRRHNGSDAVFVRDNGVGFSMKFADKLFGVFQRLHRQEDFEGTGVGLATVQRIIHKHHGTVWAEAELDRGATFYFTLGTGAAAAGPKGEAA